MYGMTETKTCDCEDVYTDCVYLRLESFRMEIKVKLREIQRQGRTKF